MSIFNILDQFGVFLNEQFYPISILLTLVAIIVAMATPWIVYWLNNRPKKSKLLFEGISIVDQSNDHHYDDRGPYSVGRMIIKNNGKYKARLTEAYIEKIIFNGEERKNFFPIPLFWTHGQLNINGPTRKDIYPNQTVYLDIFNFMDDSKTGGDILALFAVAAGQGVDNLMQMNIGKSEIFVKLYQESGQVDKLLLKLHWDGINVPDLSIF